MLGLNVVDPITVEYLKRYNKKKNEEVPESKKDDDDKVVEPEEKTNDENTEVYKKKYFRMAKVFLEAIQQDLKLFDSVKTELSSTDDGIEDFVNQRLISLRRLERTCSDILSKKPSGKSSVSSLSPVQHQLQAQRERDLKGNPLVYKAWRKATPIASTLPDDYDDAWWEPEQQ
jgi:hypothetical protein